MKVALNAHFFHHPGTGSGQYLAHLIRAFKAGAAPSERSFEAVWSLDPRVVRDASRVCSVLADGYRPGWRPAGPQSGPSPAKRCGCLGLVVFMRCGR